MCSPRVHTVLLFFHERDEALLVNAGDSELVLPEDATGQVTRLGVIWDAVLRLIAITGWREITICPCAEQLNEVDRRSLFGPQCAAVVFEDVNARQRGLKFCDLGFAPALACESLPDGLEGGFHRANAHE